MKRARGFTLIEIMVSVAILAMDDDGNVVAAGVRHRRSIGGVARNEMLSDPSPPCPAKSRVGAAATRYIPLSSLMVIEVTVRYL